MERLFPDDARNPRILVVDDEPEFEILVVQRFKHILLRDKYTFVFARTAVVALKVLQADPDIDLVMTDINMPGMDGLTFLSRINLLDRPPIKTIVVSAYDDMENIRLAMNHGAFDFITKPINFHDFEITIDKSLEEVKALRSVEELRSQVEAMAESRRRQQSIFARKLLETQEMERKKIAGELHDSLGQVILIIRNKALLGLHTPDDPALVGEQFREISEFASQTLDEVRQISRALRPYQLDKFGLTDALHSMFSQLKESTSIRFYLDIDNIDGLFSKEHEINVYRVIQEAANNILKHSRATEASMSIHVDNSRVKIEIRDNGDGFEIPEVLSDSRTEFPGFGLSGMAERVYISGGIFSIESTPDHGTRLMIEIPTEAGSNE